MLRRSLLVFLVAVATALFAFQPAFADDKPHEGAVVSAGDGKLTITFKGDAKKHTHDVAKDAKITLDGKAAKLEDFKAGFHVKVTMDDKHVITAVEAHSKAK